MAVMLCGWEGRLVIALAMLCITDTVVHLYELNGLGKGDEHPAYTLHWSTTAFLPLPLTEWLTITAHVLEDRIACEFSCSIFFYSLLTAATVTEAKRSSASVYVSVCLSVRTIEPKRLKLQPRTTKLAITGIVHHASWLPI